MTSRGSSGCTGSARRYLERPDAGAALARDVARRAWDAVLRMARVDGLVPVVRRRRSEIFPDTATRTAIGHHFVDVLAEHHSIDPKATGLAMADSTEAAVLLLFGRRYTRSRSGSSLLLIRWLIGWLRNNIATSGRVGDGDYRIGNFMVRGPQIVAVLHRNSLSATPSSTLRGRRMPCAFRGRTHLSTF